MILICLILFPAITKSEVVDQILARVGDQIITTYDVIEYSPAQIRSIYQIDSPYEREEKLNLYKKAILNQLIEYAILDIASQRIGITVSEQEINSVMKELSKQNSYFRKRYIEIYDREHAVTPELYLFVKAHVIQSKLAPEMNSRMIVTQYDVENFLVSQGKIPENHYQYDIDLVYFDNQDNYDSFLKLYKSGENFEKSVEGFGNLVSLKKVTVNDLIEPISKKLKFMKEGNLSSPVKDDSGSIIIMRLNNLYNFSSLSPEDEQVAYEYVLERESERVFKEWINIAQDVIPVIRYDY